MTKKKKQPTLRQQLAIIYREQKAWRSKRWKMEIEQDKKIEDLKARIVNAEGLLKEGHWVYDPDGRGGTDYLIGEEKGFPKLRKLLDGFFGMSLTTDFFEISSHDGTVYLKPGGNRTLHLLIEDYDLHINASPIRKQIADLQLQLADLEECLALMSKAGGKK